MGTWWQIVLAWRPTMRDSSIHQMHTMNTKRSMLLLNQFSFLETRMSAYEQLTESRWEVLKAIFNPVAFRRRVDSRQQELLSQRRKLMEEVQEAKEAKAQIIKPTLVRANG